MMADSIDYLLHYDHLYRNELLIPEDNPDENNNSTSNETERSTGLSLLMNVKY